MTLSTTGEGVPDRSVADWRDVFWVVRDIALLLFLPPPPPPPPLTDLAEPLGLKPAPPAARKPVVTDSRGDMLKGIEGFKKDNLKKVSPEARNSRGSPNDGNLTTVLQNALDGLALKMNMSDSSDDDTGEDDEDWSD